MIKKTTFSANEIKIYDDGLVYKRGTIWQFRCWSKLDRRYVKKSLGTTRESVAVDKGKKLYLEIMGHIEVGKKYFSLSIVEAVRKYIAHKQGEVDAGIITQTRLACVKIHLDHCIKFLGANTKLRDLKSNHGEKYLQTRLGELTKQSTIEIEQTSINGMIRWLHKNGDSNISGLEFRKLPRVDKNSDSVRRATITTDEWSRMCVVMRKNSSTDLVNQKKVLELETMRYYFLISANSGLRTGEQCLLRWKDVQIVEQTYNGKSVTLAEISVRAETSKVRRSRRFLCRKGEYFTRLKSLRENVLENDLVFSVDGTRGLLKEKIRHRFQQILQLAHVDDYQKRKIVPYSLRHFMISQRITAGRTYAQIGVMCGTSATLIENTYFHLSSEGMKSNALADYRRTQDGTIEII